MGKYHYFKKGELDIHLKNETIVAPEYINKGAKNYRFNLENNILEKKCISCNKFFEVQKYSDGSFIDIHDEEQIHYFSEISGFQGKCKKCLETDMYFEKNESLTNIEETGLSEINQNYIQILSLIKKQSEEKTLNFIVDIIRKHNKIDYKENIN